MGFQLHLLSGVKEVFFFQFPKDLPLGLELSFRWAGDDDHPFTDVWAFCWGDLQFTKQEGNTAARCCSLSPFWWKWVAPLLARDHGTRTFAPGTLTLLLPPWVLGEMTLVPSIKFRWEAGY